MKKSFAMVKLYDFFAFLMRFWKKEFLDFSILLILVLLACYIASPFFPMELQSIFFSK